MHHRIILIDTVQLRDLNLVDFPVDENNSLDRCLYEERTNDQEKYCFFHTPKLIILGVKRFLLSEEGSDFVDWKLLFQGFWICMFFKNKYLYLDETGVFMGGGND